MNRSITAGNIFFPLSLPGECVECTATDVPILVALAIAVVFLLLLLQASSRDSSGATIKILVAFAQTVYSFFSTNENSPVRGGALLNLSPLEVSRQCVVPMDDLSRAVLPIFQIGAVYAILGLLWMTNLAWRAVLRLARRGSPGPFGACFVRVLLGVTVFSYIPLFRVAVRLTQCVDVDGVSLLQQYPGVECAGSAYTAWLVAAWSLAGSLFVFGGIFVWTAGQRQYRLYMRIPTIVIPEQQRASLRRNIEARWGFLFRSYRGVREDEGSNWRALERVSTAWEHVIMTRSSLFVLSATLVSDWQSRFSLLTVGAFASLALHNSVRPYATIGENRMEAASLCTLVLIGAIQSSEWYGSDIVVATTTALFYGFVAFLVLVVASDAVRGRHSRKGRRASSLAQCDRRAIYRFFCWHDVEHEHSVASSSTSSLAGPAAAVSGVELAPPVARADSARRGLILDASGHEWQPVWRCKQTGSFRSSAPSVPREAAGAAQL